MKIIAETKDEFVIVASKDEIAQLIGYNSAWTANRENAHPRIGDIVNVSPMFSRLYEIARAPGQIKAAQGTLRAVAEILDTVKPVIPVKEEQK